MTLHELSFAVGGVQCSGWHFPGAGADDARPVVVMAHGFGGTKDSGLQPFAERFAAAGLDVLAFDYRGFGTSEGAPRQKVSITGQIEDYQGAIAAAQRLPGVAADRVVLWGSSLSGGHVLRVAAGRADIAAVISMTPMTNAFATARQVLAQYGPGPAVQSTVRGLRSRVASVRGRDPVLMPIVSRPGDGGALALDGAFESYLGIAGPSWRNEVDATVGMELSKISTAKYAKALRVPLLLQIADFDRYVPADASARAAVQGRAVVHHYPCDHFDVWPGHDWFARAADDQVRFLARVLMADRVSR